MIFRKLKRLFAGLLGVLMIFCGVTTSVVASSQVGMVVSSISSEKVAILLFFPEMTWDGAFELTLEYDPAVLQYSSSGCNRSSLSAEDSHGIVTIKGDADGKGETWANTAVEVSVLFRVLDYTSGSAIIKCVPKDIYDQSQVLAVSGTSLLTVTLKAPTPSTEPSTDSLSTDSLSTDSDLGSFTDNGTDSSVPTDITSDSETETDTHSSAKEPDSDITSDKVSDSDITSDKVSDVVSDSETLTDTTDTVQIDGSTDSQESDRVLPIPSSTERRAVLLLVGAAVVLIVLSVVELMRRRRRRR